jgi:5,10-methylenetetrahydromethanopterin reductase
MSKNKNGILFVGAPSVPEQVKLAQRAEQKGFDSIWVAETRVTRDGLTPAAAIAASTERVRIGTGIINVYTRGAVLLAVSFVSLEELAPGRIIMGLGAGSPNVLAPQGYEFRKPLTRLREYCDVIPRLIAGENVTFEGKEINLDGAQIEDLLSSNGQPGGPRTRIPLHIGATGPKALEYAGGVADGILMNACLSTSYVKSRLEIVERGAKKAGRSLDDIEIGIAVVCSPDHDRQKGLDGARRFIALYLSVMPNIARETGLDEELVERIRSTFHSEGLEAAMGLVGDEIVDDLAVAGTPDDCRRRLDEYREAGIDLCVLAPMEGTIDLIIDELHS